MIYCGSGSDFGKVSVPVPVPDPFHPKKFVHNLAFSMSDAALFPRKLASNFLFLTFYSILC
jgi:hypothetical protein